MVTPISSLANMEMALYGGVGLNANAPSYINGYRGGNNHASSYIYPSFYGNSYGAYNNYNSYNNQTFGQNIPYNYGSTTTQQQTRNSVFQGLTNKESQAILDDYAKSLTPSEGFFACAATNAAFGLAMNPRIIAHPINTFRATFSADNATNKAFAYVKDANHKLHALWNNPENSNILREAWLQHNKAVARCNYTKLGAFRRSYGAIDKTAKGLIEKEIQALEAALKAGNMQKITYHTARLQHAYSANEGFITRGWNWCRNGIGKLIPDSWTTVKGAFTSNPTSVAEKLKDKKGIDKRILDLNNTKATGYKDILKRGGGVKGGLFFMAIEYLMSLGKIKSAFEEDTETGMKQLGQTTVKAAGNAAGWAIGEAAGAWAFAKWGAKIGSKVHPLLGTLIGGAVGLVGGGLGMWLAGKGTHALVGQDVGDKIEAKKLAQSEDGQIQLLQNTMQRIQNGEKVSPEAQMAVQKLISQYA